MFARLAFAVAINVEPDICLLYTSKVAAQWPLIKEKYSFEARARELVEIVEKYGKKDK